MGTYENPFEVNNELKNRYTHIRSTENIEKTSVENNKNFGTNFGFNEKKSFNYFTTNSRKNWTF